MPQLLPQTVSSSTQSTSRKPGRASSDSGEGADWDLVLEDGAGMREGGPAGVIS